MNRRDFLKIGIVASATLVLPGLRQVAPFRIDNLFRLKSSVVHLHGDKGEFSGCGYEPLQTYADEWGSEWIGKRFQVFNAKPLQFPIATGNWGDLTRVTISGVEKLHCPDFVCGTRRLSISTAIIVMFDPREILIWME